MLGKQLCTLTSGQHCLLSIPTAASEKPMPADTKVLNGEAPPSPMKQANDRK